MTDPIRDLIVLIDVALAKKFAGKFYALCELVNGPAERYPVTIAAAKRERVSPADTWQLQIYHRLLTAQRLSDQEFGRNEVWEQVVRMVIISNPNMGETLPIRIVKEFPRQVVATESSAVITDVMSLNSDHEQIALTEFNTIPEDKHRLTKNLFVIEYTLRLQLCPK